MDFGRLVHSVKPRAWLREPLVHFLAAGALLYLGAAWLGPVPEDGRTIVIDDDRLAAALQQRAGIANDEAVREALLSMAPDERAKLVRETAAEEALWREGRARGLDTVDGVVRLRTIQNMRQLLTEEATANLAVSDAEVADFYARNRDTYAESASASFSHLFFAGPNGEARARAALAGIRAGAAPEEFGDRFVYQATYAEAGAEELAGQFGIGFVESLSKLAPSRAWQGPLKSDRGWHLVLLRGLVAARVPPLDAIEDRVREDALAAARARVTERAVDRLLERYEVRTR